MFKPCMLALVGVLATVSLAQASGPTRHASLDYRCHGVRGVRGDLELKLGARDTVRVSGSYLDTNDSRASQIYVDCAGRTGRVERSFRYYDVRRTRACPADYIRFHQSFRRDGKGLVALVSRSGGDNHDWSGYSYVYYFCSVE